MQPLLYLEEELKVTIKKTFLFLFIFILFLSGCGKKETELCSEELFLNTKEKLELNITPEIKPSIYIGKNRDGNLLFVERLENDEKVEYSVYSEDIDKAKVSQLDIQFDNIIKGINLCNYENQECLCALTGGKNGCLLTMASLDGEKINELELNPEIFDEGYCVDITFASTGEFFILMDNQIVILNEKGESVKTIKCPKGIFQGMIHSDKDEIFVSCFDDNKATLYCYDVVSGDLKKKTDIVGDGRIMCKYKESQILCFDSHEIVAVDTNGGTRTVLGNLDELSIGSNSIKKIFQNGENVEVVSQYMGAPDSPVYFFTLSNGDESTVIQKAEKVEIVINDIDGFFLMSYPDIVNEFNEQSESSKVSVKLYDEDMNFWLASKDAPDIVFSINQATMKTLAASGYLADLLNCEGVSESIKVETIRQELKNFYKDGEMYFLPVRFYTTLFAGDKEKIGDRTGWTSEEFVDWLGENEDVNTNFPLTKDNILGMCLQYSYDGFIDYSLKTNDFDSEEFKNLLSKINNLSIKDDISDLNFFNNETIGNDLQLVSVSNVVSALDTSFRMGKEITYVGYPSSDGRPISSLTVESIGILSTSKNKKGAYEFVKFFFEHFPSYDITFAAYSPLFELGVEEMGDHYSITENGKTVSITEEQKEMALETLNWTEEFRPDVYSIMGIIASETKPYFAGEKSVDEVCGIIANRVQIYLDENY